MNDNRDLGQAISELKIKHKTIPGELAEIDQILFQILCYPSVKDAEDHHMAHSMGTNDLIEGQKEIQRNIRGYEVQNLQVCRCCGMILQDQQLPYCISFDELKIGVGVHLYFRNLKFNAILFALMFLIYSIYSLVTNIFAFHEHGSDLNDLLCVLQNNGCGLSDLGTGSKILRQIPVQQINDTVVIQSILGIVFVSLWGIMTMIKRHIEKKFIVEMETKRDSASDFTLMLVDMPQIYLSHSYEQNLEGIKAIFKRYERKLNSIYSYDVVKINVARPIYNESESNKEAKKQLRDQLDEKLQVFRNWIEHRKTYYSFPVPFSRRMNLYEQYIQFYTQSYDLPSLHNVPLEAKNIVFVTMRSSKARQEIAKFNKPPSWKNLWNLCSEESFPIKGVTIIKAPQPQQIKWENIGFSKESKRCRKVMILLLTLILIGISLGISIGVAFIDIQNSEVGNYHQYVSVAVSLVVTIFNVGIQMSIMYLSYFQNEFINSVQQSNIALKIGIGQLLNSIGVPLVISIIKVKSNTSALLAAGGLVEDVFFISLFSLFSPIGRLIDPFHLFLEVKRWYYSKPSQRLKMHGQKQLNAHYGNYEFDIGYEYAYIIKTSIFTAFFVPMQPIIALFAPIGLFMYYLVNKRNLLYHFQRPCYHDFNINSVVDMILLLSPIAFGFGHLTVINFIPENNEDINQLQETIILNWAIVIIGVAFFFLVPLRIFSCCMQEPEIPQKDFFEKKPLLYTDYDRMNPITKNQAIQDFEFYLNELEERQELPDHSQMVKFTVSNIKKGDDNFSLIKLLQGKKSMMMGQDGKMEPQYNEDLQKYRNFIHREGSGIQLK